MAQIGSVSFIANASGLTAGAQAAGRAFKVLGGDANSLRADLAAIEKAARQSFEGVGPQADAARAAFTGLTTEAGSLRDQFAAGSITSNQFAAGMQGVTDQANAMARALANAAAITKANTTAAEDYFARLDRLKEAIKLGGLSEEAAAREREAALQAFLAAERAADQLSGSLGSLRDVSDEVASIEFENPVAGMADEIVAQMQDIGAATDFTIVSLEDMSSSLSSLTAAGEAVADSSASLAEAHQRGAAVARANMTAEERYAAELEDLDNLLRVGAIDMQTYQRATAAAAARMKDGADAAEEMTSELGGVNSRLNALIGLNLAGIFTSITSQVTNTVRSLVSFGAEEAKAINTTADLATRLDLTYAELAGLELAAQRAGVGTDQLSGALTKADVTLVKALQGSKEANEVFKLLGLSAAELNNQSPGERFAEISDAISSLPTAAERSAAAIALFGKGGAELVPLFNAGAGAIRAATSDADAFGLALTGAQAADVKAMNDSFARGFDAVKGITDQVVAYLAPTVATFVDQFSTFIADVGGANIGQRIGDGLVAGAEYVAGVADGMIAGLSTVWTYVSSVGDQWNAVTAFLNRVGGFFDGIWQNAKIIFYDIVLLFSQTFEDLAVLAQGIGGYLGFDTSDIDSIVAGAQAFNDEIEKGITDANKKAADAWKRAFGPEQVDPAGKALAGPLQQAVRDARAAAQAAAIAADPRRTGVQITSKAEDNPVAAVNQALQGVESRSKEGVAEMFRIMRGGSGDVQVKQLSVLEQIKQNTDNIFGEGVYAFGDA
jgi:hypothetical protein